MYRLLSLVVLLCLVGCGQTNESFAPTADAQLASVSDYVPVHIVYPVIDGAWLRDQQSRPMFAVTGSGEEAVAFMIPMADRARLQNLIEGTILSLPTLSQYNRIDAWYGKPAAAALIKSIAATAADTEGVVKLTTIPPQLTVNTDITAFVAIRCYVQRVRERNDTLIVPMSPSIASR